MFDCEDVFQNEMVFYAFVFILTFNKMKIIVLLTMIYFN
jgi:hypothetical protein